jgi:hypothetical protein
VIASFGFAVFNLAVATGKDLQTVLICRFFSGFFGACPLTVSIRILSLAEPLCLQCHLALETRNNLERLVYLQWHSIQLPRQC